MSISNDVMDDINRWHRQTVAEKDKRIAELETALRELLKHDDERFGFEGEPSKVEARCRAVLEKKINT